MSNVRYNAGTMTIEVDGRTMRVFSNHMVDLDRFVDFDPVAECGIKERVRESVLKLSLIHI